MRQRTLKFHSYISSYLREDILDLYAGGAQDDQLAIKLLTSLKSDCTFYCSWKWLFQFWKG